MLTGVRSEIWHKTNKIQGNAIPLEKQGWRIDNFGINPPAPFAKGDQGKKQIYSNI
jgi:hypothetical protein